MARESTTTVPEHRPRAANDDHHDDDGEEAGSVQQIPITIPTKIDYPKLPRTSLTAEASRRESFYVCEEDAADGDGASELDLATQLKHTQLDLADFKRMARKDPESLFAMILKRERLWTLYANAKDKEEQNIAAARQNHDQELEAVQAEYERLKTRLKDSEQRRQNAEDERNDFALRLLRQPTNNDSRGTPIVEATSRRSVKLPDPPLLDDGKNPRFEDWHLQMRSKLKANADHFFTPDLRMAYVASRCTGRAAKHITPRMREDATMPYHDSPDMLKHLDDIFGDPNRLVNARRGYRELVMKPGNDFNNFLSDFLHLADEAGVPVDSRKEDFYQKLTWDLQNAVMMEADDTDFDFAQFTKICLNRWNRLDMQAAQKRRGARNRQNASAVTTGRNETLTPTVSRFKRESTAGTEDRTMLMKEGRCFICKVQGHLSRDCPHKKKAAVAAVTTKELERYEEPRKNDDYQEKDSA